MSMGDNMQKDVLVMNLKEQLDLCLKRVSGKSLADASDSEICHALIALVKELSDVTPGPEGEKKVYYISAEFLIGKLLSNNLIKDRVKRIIDFFIG